MCAHTQKAPSSGKNAKGALTQQCAQCELLSVTSHLSPFSLYPRGYFASQEETGSSSMQMNCSEEEELAAPSQVHFHDPHTSVNRRNVYEKRRVKGQVATEYLLLSVLFLLNLTEVWLVGYWQGLTSVSPSLPLWTEARALLGLLYCAGGKLPIRATLIEQWKQEFYKGADLLFITSHSLPLFLPHASIFHWLTMQHSNFLSWSFQQLPLYCVHSFLLCWNPPPSLETPMVRLGYNVAFSVSFSKTVWVKSLLVSLSIRQIV